MMLVFTHSFVVLESQEHSATIESAENSRGFFCERKLIDTEESRGDDAGRSIES